MRDRYASLREGLIGAWIPSISGSGLLLPDLSGKGNNGSLTNMDASDWVSGQYGRALDFDGSDDYVFSNFQHIEPPFSVSCWVNLNTTTANGTMVALADSAVANQQYRLWFGDAGFGYVWAADAFNTSYAIASIARKTGASVGTWYNVVGIWERYNLRKIFVDTVQGTNSTYSVTNPTGINRAGLGVTVDSTPVNYLDGQLDDVRIYNRALSEPEIKLLSQEPGVGFKRSRRVFDFGRRGYLPPTPPDYRTVRVKQTGEHASLREGLVGAWCPSVAGEGYTLPDLSGQGNDGTLTNMGPEDWVSGQYGRALYYDGSDATTLIGDVLDNVFVGTDAKFTVSSWINLQSNGNCAIASKIGDGATGGGNNRQWLFRCLGYELDFAWYGALAATSFRVIRSDTQIQPNVTTHVAATFDASVSNPDAKAKIFLNGVEQTFTIPFTGGTPVSIQDGTARLSIGAAAGPVGATIAYDFIGQIDDTRIYNRLLSDSEIRLLASRPGIGLRPQRRSMYYAPPTGARRRRILTSMP